MQTFWQALDFVRSQNYALDPDRRELRSATTIVAMEPQVFDPLLHLIRQREHVVSRDELIGSIWGGRIVSELALNSRINAVRSAIGDSGTGQRLIKTLPRKGVRFVGEVREERKPCEMASASSIEPRALETIDLHQATEGLPAQQVPGIAAIDGHWEPLSPVAPAPLESRAIFLGSRATVAAIAAIAAIGVIRSRGDYEAARALRQWAVDLDRHNAEALANLTFALATGVLNHCSVDEVADLHAADLTLQDSLLIAPGR